jgi:integrase
MALRFARLTRPAIRGLQVGQRLQEHGITAERQKNGDVRYSVNIMVDGERVHRVIGRESDGITREQAERAIESFRTKAREGRLDLPTGRKRHRTFAEAAKEYLERLETHGGKNVKQKRRHLEQHLVPFFGTDRLDKLTEFRLRRYRKEREEAGAKPATVNRELATLSHLMNRAASKEWRWIRADDKPEIPRAEEARKPIDILTPAQSEALLKAAVGDQDPDLWLFVLFGLNTAMRHSEIVCRRYDEVDWDNCRLWIGRAKAGARVQPITPALRDSLKKRRESAEDKDGWIFPSRTKTAKRPHRLSLAKSFQRAVVRAKLNPKKVTPHTMRHTGISLLVMAGADIATIQKISGHKTVQMVMHYAHVFGSHIDSAISILDQQVPDTIAPELHTEASSASAAADSGHGEVISISKR